MPKNLRLTELAVRRLAVPDTYWDTELKAFGLRVGNRTKTFFVIKDGGRRIKIGHFPDWSLKEARREAWLLLNNPREERPTGTFADVFKEYYRLRVQPNYRFRSAQNVDRLVERHAQALKPKQLGEITQKDCTDLFDGLVRTPSEANHLFGVLRTFFNYCIEKDLIAVSPLAKTARPYKENSRERSLALKELAAVYKAAPAVFETFGKIVRLLILTGQRKNEIASLDRSFVDGDTVTLPARLVKNGREHSFAIGPMAQEIIGTLPDSGLLFPSRWNSTRPYNGWGKHKADLDKLSGVTDWTIHDLRRTFATHFPADPWVIEAQLNHQSGTLTPIAKIYNRRSYLAQAREAMVRYENVIQQLLGA